MGGDCQGERRPTPWLCFVCGLEVQDTGSIIWVFCLTHTWLAKLKMFLEFTVSLCSFSPSINLFCPFLSSSGLYFCSLFMKRKPKLTC